MSSRVSRRKTLVESEEVGKTVKRNKSAKKKTLNESEDVGKTVKKNKSAKKILVGNISKTVLKSSSTVQIRRNKNKSSASNLSRRLFSSADFAWEKERTKIAENKLKENEKVIEKCKKDYERLEMENQSLFKLVKNQNELLDSKDKIILKLSESNSELKQGLLPQDYKDNIVELENEINLLNNQLDTKQKDIVGLINQSKEDNVLIINQRKKVLKLELDLQSLKENLKTNVSDKSKKEDNTVSDKSENEVHTDDQTPNDRRNINDDVNNEPLNIKATKTLNKPKGSSRWILKKEASSLVPSKWKTNFKLAQLNLQNFKAWKNKVIRVCNIKKNATAQSILKITPPKLFNSLHQSLRKFGDEESCDKPILCDDRLNTWIAAGLREAASCAPTKCSAPKDVVDVIFNKHVSHFKSELNKILPPLPKPSVKKSSIKLKTFNDWSDNFKTDLLTEFNYGSYALNDSVEKNVLWLKRKKFSSAHMDADSITQELKKLRRESSQDRSMKGSFIPVVISDR